MMRDGCYGRSGDFTAFSRGLRRSILAGQHDHPVLLVPAGVKRDFAQVAGHGIHHPKALTLFCQVLGAISQQVPAADTEIASCSNKLCQLGFIKVFHL